jgi:hypothetical protein
MSKQNQFDANAQDLTIKMLSQRCSRDLEVFKSSYELCRYFIALRVKIYGPKRNILIYVPSEKKFKEPANWKRKTIKNASPESEVS